MPVSEPSVYGYRSIRQLALELRGANVLAGPNGCVQSNVYNGMLLLARAAAELSGGTLRYLCLIAALLSPGPPARLGLNEPETSIHPDLIEPLARLITDASRRSPLWITTHSRALAEHIAAFGGEEPVRLALVDGETRIQ